MAITFHPAGVPNPNIPFHPAPARPGAEPAPNTNADQDSGQMPVDRTTVTGPSNSEQSSLADSLSDALRDAFSDVLDNPEPQNQPSGSASPDNTPSNENQTSPRSRRDDGVNTQPTSGTRQGRDSIPSAPTSIGGSSGRSNSGASNSGTTNSGSGSSSSSSSKPSK